MILIDFWDKVISYSQKDVILSALRRHSNLLSTVILHDAQKGNYEC